MIKSFEGGRGLAAILVALMHLHIGEAYVSPIRNGYLFVDLFFVLSGFVICASYSTRLGTLEEFREFLVRRFGRLFPLLIFSTILFVITKNSAMAVKRYAVELGYTGLFKTPGSLDYAIPNAAEIISTVTLTHGLGFFDKLILNFVSWSISTEFYAYVLFALLCLFLHGRIRLLVFALISVIGFFMATWASITLHDCLQQGKCLDITYDFGFARCTSSFFLGALVYHAGKTAQFNANAIQLAGLVALALVFALTDAVPAVALASPLLFAVLVLSISRDTGVLSKILMHPLFQLLGQRSYSIYMMHPVLIFFFDPFKKYMAGLVSGTAAVLAYLAILIVVSGWTYTFIEDPFRKMFNRIASRKTKQETSLPVALPTD